MNTCFTHCPGWCVHRSTESSCSLCQITSEVGNDFDYFFQPETTFSVFSSISCLRSAPASPDLFSHRRVGPSPDLHCLCCYVRKLVHWCLFDQHCSTGFISGRVPKLKIDQQCCRIANVFSRVFFQSFVPNLPLKRWSVNRASTSRNRPGDTGSKEFFLLMIFTHLDKGQKFLSANEAFSANASAGDLFKG